MPLRGCRRGLLLLYGAVFCPAVLVEFGVAAFHKIGTFCDLVASDRCIPHHVFAADERGPLGIVGRLCSVMQMLAKNLGNYFLGRRLCRFILGVWFAS